MQENLLGLVEQADAVGAGGAGFPTHVKFEAQADTATTNGVEREPLLRVSQQLMALQADDLLDALGLLVEQAGASQGVVALEEHYYMAVEALRRELSRHPKLRIHRMSAPYLIGDEQVIAYEVIGRVVPEGGIPLNVGAVVSGVETVLNALTAVCHQAPVIEKYVTLTGAVCTPKTVKMPLGITVVEALALASGPIVEHCEVINGGSMTGRAMSVGSAITKTTKGFIIVPEGHFLFQNLSRFVPRMPQDARVACMQCSLCSEACPRGLLGHRIQPYKMMCPAAYGVLCNPEYTPMNVLLCCGCCLCEYACVMGLQPWKLDGMFRGEMGKKGVCNALHNQPEAVAPFRQYKRYPAHKLIHQLGLDGCGVPAPMEDSSCDCQMATLPLGQGVGAPVQPVVRAGDRVEKEVLIAAAPEGKLGANLHAGTAGTVTAVTEREITIQQ